MNVRGAGTRGGIACVQGPVTVPGVPKLTVLSPAPSSPDHTHLFSLPERAIVSHSPRGPLTSLYSLQLCEPVVKKEEGQYASKDTQEGTSCVVFCLQPVTPHLPFP